jgi:hypothetical protein
MNRLRLFLNRNYLFTSLQGVVQKLAKKRRSKHKEKNHFALKCFAKKIRVFSGAAQVQKAST